MEQSYLVELRQKFLSRFSESRLFWLGHVITAPITWILLLTALSFLFYSPVFIDANGRTPYFTCSDINGYSQYLYNGHSCSLFKGETRAKEVPVYPYFLKTIYWITGKDSILAETKRDEFGNPVSDTIIQGQDTCFYVVLVQRILYLLALIPFYFACRLILKNPLVCFFSVLFVAVYFFQYQSWILTEPLAISGMMVFFAWMIFYLNKPTIKSAFALPLFVFLMLMERPVFVYLAILLLGFFLLRLIISPDRKQSLAGLTSLLLVGILIHGYSLLNLRNHGVYTLSSVSITNRFVIISSSGMFRKSTDTEMVNYINNSPLLAADARYPLSTDITKQFGIERKVRFVNQVIKDHLLEFVITNIKNMYWEMDLTCFQPAYVLGFIDFLFIIISSCFFRKFPWVRLGIWGLVFGMFVVIYQAGWDSHERLIIPALPMLMLIGAKYIDIAAVAFYQSKDEFWNYLKETL